MLLPLAVYIFLVRFHEEHSKNERERAKEHTELILPFSLTQLRNNDDDNNDDQRRIRSFFVAPKDNGDGFHFLLFLFTMKPGKVADSFGRCENVTPFMGNNGETRTVNKESCVSIDCLPEQANSTDPKRRTNRSGNLELAAPARLRLVFFRHVQQRDTSPWLRT